MTVNRFKWRNEDEGDDHQKRGDESLDAYADETALSFQMTRARINELEAQVSVQANQISDLNGTVSSQNNQITSLHNTNNSLQHKLRKIRNAFAATILSTAALSAIYYYSKSDEEPDVAGAINLILEKGSFDLDLRDQLLEEKLKTLMDSGDVDSAIFTINELLERHPENVSLIVDRGSLFVSKANENSENIIQRNEYLQTAEREFSLSIRLHYTDYLLHKKSAITPGKRSSSHNNEEWYHKYSEDYHDLFRPPFFVIEQRADVRERLGDFNGALQDLFEMKSQLSEGIRNSFSSTDEKFHQLHQKRKAVEERIEKIDRQNKLMKELRIQY